MRFSLSNHFLAILSITAGFNGSGPFKFDYLLGENQNFSSTANVLFVDHDVDEHYIRQIMANGKRVICYVNVGAWEDWRSDAEDFPDILLGNNYNGWPGERWLDVRNLNVLLPIMEKRFKDAAAKGCQGIDPDNMNGWSVDTGFPISFNDQLVYNRAIPGEIRKLGMLAGLKNDNEQTVQLEPYNDFAVNEECVQWNACDAFNVFIAKNKPVFVIEYTGYWNENNYTNQACPLAQSTGMSIILKHLNLHNNFTVSVYKPVTKQCNTYHVKFEIN